MSFPRQYARTRRFTLGQPRDITVAPDGDRVLFLRSSGPEDPVNDLWQWTPDGERLLLGARDELARGGSELPAAERARRERQREAAAGLTSYATDRAARLVATSLAGRLLTVDVATGEVAEHPLSREVFDPRPSPDGEHIAYVRGGALEVTTRDGDPKVLAAEDGISWGLADFVAAEEMHRFQGFWWSPDGSLIAACRVDEREVPIWFIADPSRPEREPAVHRYPAAGTTNPDVTLHLIGVEGGDRTEIRWDRERYPYLARVMWENHHPLTLLVQDRSQRRWRVLVVDTDTGATSVIQQDQDPAWLELVDGVPAWTADGGLVTVLDVADGGSGARRLVVDGEPVSPTELQLETVIAVDGNRVWFTAFDGPFDLGVWTYDATSDELSSLTPGEGWSGATVGGGTAIVRTSTVHASPRFSVRRDGQELGELTSHLADPLVSPAPRFLRLGDRGLPAALLLPTEDPGGSLPVLLAPYGGPGLTRARQARRSREPLLEPQWFADQGFAVLVTDNRGMPGVDVRFEKAIAGDLATCALEDQIAGLQAASELEPRLDLDRVGIRGWSFGGFLAALAVLRRPDVFHAAVAGAPVTDWRLYDTHYTERYLGLPNEHPDAYRASSLVDSEGQLVAAAPWDDDRDRLLVIHGLADDNVVAAHSLRLSAALLADGRPHRFLPLSGVTHMTPQEVVAENLLHLQLDFLRRSLGVPAGG